MTYRFATASEVGPRPDNQDAVAVWPLTDDRMAVAIADGLGGYHGGRQASDTAIRMIGAAFDQEVDVDLRSQAYAIHDEIRKQQQLDAGVRGMATTLSAALLTHGRISYVHCGDTRIVIQRRNGIKRLTVDQTEAQRLLDAGSITRDEFASYPRKHVLQSALGIADIPRIDVGSWDTLPGDRIFLSSDGVHGKVFVREILEISKLSTSPEIAVSEIMKLVDERGPEDNYSLAAIFID